MGVIIFYSLLLVQVEKMNAEKNLEMYDTYRVKGNWEISFGDALLKYQ